MAHTRSMPPDDNDGDDEGPFSRSMRWPRKCALTVTSPIYKGPIPQVIGTLNPRAATAVVGPCDCLSSNDERWHEVETAPRLIVDEL